jgi:hypothetical protein
MRVLRFSDYAPLGQAMTESVSGKTNTGWLLFPALMVRTLPLFSLANWVFGFSLCKAAACRMAGDGLACFSVHSVSIPFMPIKSEVLGNPFTSSA